MATEEQIADPEQASTFDKPNAVVDTNVVLAIYSWHDVLVAIEQVKGRDPQATLTDPAVQFRAQRARTAFHLALFLNERAWMTAGPGPELLRVLATKAPPATGEQGIKSNYVRLFVHFVREKLLQDWIVGSNSGSEEGLKGDDVDRLFLSWAEEHRVPLISWEGHGPNGLDPRRLIPKEAAARGIDLVTPEQLLARMNFDEGAAVRRFFDRWDEHASAFVTKTPTAKETVQAVRVFYGRLAANDWTS